MALHHPRRLYKRPGEETQWVEKINDELCIDDTEIIVKWLENSMSSMTPSIFMAPAPLRGLKHQAFIPQVVPIGPYHCDVGPHHSSFPENHESQRYIDIAAQEMERHKIMASKYVAKNFKEGHSICSLASKFESKVGEIKQEYGSQLACNQSDKRLALILALDASFVVEVLKCNAVEADLNVKRQNSYAAQSFSTSTRHKQYWQASWTRSTSRLQNGVIQQGEYEAIRQVKMMQSTLSANDIHFNSYYCNRFPLPLRKSILQDFVLLENQIPLSCLLEVVQTEGSCKSGTVAEAGTILGPLVVEIASEVLPFCVNKKVLVTWMNEHMGRRKHLLDCLYTILTYACPATTKEDLVLNPTHFPRAVELYNSGISFEPQPESENLMHVHFDPKRAKLCLPKVRVGDDTEKLFRNLIAYESHMIDNVAVLSYLRFMNNLVDDQDDVALLIHKGIITEDIGNDVEVAHMWNNLCVNTMRVCSKSYEETSQQMLMHCNRKVEVPWKRSYLEQVIPSYMHPQKLVREDLENEIDLNLPPKGLSEKGKEDKVCRDK
ncbi:hypothetical protein GOP47_0004891 [Adiantum capillus-veneris]|uniref:Uncharacterized protein n=1 Tax=Adiantum capillus-veneris TaxID=13818 RepID=A0A9D4V4V1_ADICA|nr:hypothetical protein GOP47_0004891 [Adiantum capillus-veneris]